VQRSARHLLALINDLLDLAKIEAGKVELHMEPVAVQPVLEDVIASLRPLAEEKGLALEAVAPPGELWAQGDQRSLKQILINLVNNAIKFTEQGAVRVEVERGEADGRAEIRCHVSDSGIGIKAEDLSRLFRSFERVGSSEARRQEGTGLGLRLSQRLAELMGGQISVRSEYGAGSTFSLTLPEA
jgi:signal transduction histidine kinase